MIHDPEPLMFVGLVGASAAIHSREIWHSDGTPKSTVDLMRVPWVRDHIRQEMRDRYEWRATHQ